MIDLRRDVPNTCHADPGAVFSPHLRPPYAWHEGRENKAYGGAEPWRGCDYCGSMHPLDLLKFYMGGDVVRLECADWKYGWPHKFYIDVKNPHEGKPACTGSTSLGVQDGDKSAEQVAKENTGYVNWRRMPNGRWEGDRAPSPAPATMHGKFYSEHLIDLLPEELEELTKRIQAATGVQFVLEGRRLRYAKL